MNNWKETKSANLSDVSSVKEIIENLAKVRGFLQEQIAADLKNIEQTQVQIEKMRKGRVG